MKRCIKIEMFKREKKPDVFAVKLNESFKQFMGILIE